MYVMEFVSTDGNQDTLMRHTSKLNMQQEVVQILRQENSNKRKRAELNPEAEDNSDPRQVRDLFIVINLEKLIDERRLQKQREYNRMRRQDPEFREKHREYNRRKRQDPAVWEKQNAALRKKYAQDKEYREKMILKASERAKKRRLDTVVNKDNL